MEKIIMERAGRKESILEKSIHNIFFLATVLSLAVYCFDTSVNSDMVEGVYWANASLESGKFLSHDFYYSYAIPFGANIFMLPFVKLFGVSLLANQLGMLLFYAVLLLIILYFSWALWGEWKTAAFTSAVILLSFRSQMGVNLLHHILHYQLGFVCLLGMVASVLRIQRAAAHKWEYVLLGVHALWSGVNGVVTISLSVIPLIVGMAIILMSQSESKNNLKCFAIIGALTACGWIIYVLLMQGVHDSGYIENAGSFSFLSTAQWIENLRKLPEDWLNLFMIILPDNQSVFSTQGVEIAFQLAVAIIAGLMPLVYVCIFKKLTEREKLILYVAITVWAVCLAQYALLRGAEIRLLYCGMMMNFILLAVWLKRINSVLCQKWGGMLKYFCVLLMSAYAVSFAAHCHFTADRLLTDFLTERGLNYGFATYWNAMNNTVLSNGNVKINQVFVNSGIVVPMLYSSELKWYEPQDRDFFLVLTEDEIENIWASHNKALFTIAKDSAEIGNYTVLIYDRANWERVLQGKVFDFSLADAADDFWASGCNTVDGIRHIHDGGLSFGPYLRVEQGDRYTVTIHGENLSFSECQAYDWAQQVYYEMNCIKRTDNEILFSIPISVSGTLEIGISNPIGDTFTDDVLLESVVIDID